MTSQLDNVVTYGSSIAVLAWLVSFIWALRRMVRVPNRPAWRLVAWSQVALQALFLLRDFVYRHQPVQGIHFAIRCGSVFFLVVLAVRMGKVRGVTGFGA